MGTLTIRALRIVIAMVLAGSLFVQAVMVPIIATDIDEVDPTYLQVAFVTFLVLGILAVQICAICVWKLATMVRAGTVFSLAAFRYVDVIIGAVGAASLLPFVMGVLVAPGEDVAPGIVLLLGGLGVLIAGIALIVLVLRMLLTQAVALDTETHHLQAELDGVI